MRLKRDARRRPHRRRAAQGVGREPAVGRRQLQCAVPWRCPQICSGRHVDPAPLFPALQRRLDQLHALGAFRQGPAIGLVLDHVADEMLPLDLEAVVVDLRVGHFLPLVEEVHGLLLVRVPDRPRRRHRGFAPGIPAARPRPSRACRRRGRSPGRRGARASPTTCSSARSPARRCGRPVRPWHRRRRRRWPGRAARLRPSAAGMCVAPMHETDFTSPNRLSST